MAIVRLSYTPAEPAATVTAVRLYTTPARTGTPAFTGTPVASAGTWTVSPNLTDGPYYSAFDVTDSTGSYTDADDFFYVLDGQIAPGSQIVSIHDVRTITGLTDATKDREQVELISAAVPVIEDWVGPILPRTVTETPVESVLSQRPVLAVTSVTKGGSAVTTPYTLNGPAGLVTGLPTGTVVTYTAGYRPIPSNIRRAVLRWVAWSWRRDHGGSETYLPAGDDATPIAPGVGGIEREIWHILGPYRRGPHVG